MRDDRPFVWGSKRTGPDLHRVGNYRTTEWHENHMMNPPSIVPGSIMPKYPHLFENQADIATVMRMLILKSMFSVFLMMQKVCRNLELGKRQRLKL